MAWSNNNTNGGYNTYGYRGGSGTYPDHGHRPMIVVPDGQRHSIVGYSESYNAQRYMAQTEKVVEYRRGPAMSDYKMSPPKKEVYKDHGERDKPLIARWGSTREQPEKGDRFSPKGGNIVHRPSSPRSKDQYHSPRGYGKYNNNFSDASGDDDDDDDDHDEKIKESGYSPPPYNAPLSNTPPRKETYYDTPYNEKHKGNGYAGPPYTLPTSNNHPKRDAYYETSYKDRDEDYKENNYPPPTYTVPVSNTPPKRDAYYDKSNNKPIPTSLAPIKTRNDTGRNDEFITNKSPPVAQRTQFNGSPRKDQNSQKVIDSAEARRLYGKASSGSGAPIEEKYKGIIDSKEAARRYNGVFLPN